MTGDDHGTERDEMKSERDGKETERDVKKETANYVIFT
jgi:hypothetical protein